ncbi:MAG: polysaccharide biosynthesis/export family protein [Candidatus Omnitrophota bacterium]
MRRLKSKLRTLFYIVVCIFALNSPSYAQQQSGSKYILGTGDIIEISVWNHQELKSTLSIRPDGFISYPVAGEIQAAGQTTTALADQIHEKLLVYLKDPKISVNVIESRSKKVLVLGEVKTPGLYTLENQMTAFESIGLAGGYLKYAELRSILVIRKPYSECPQFILVNLHKALDHANTSENVLLEPKDIIYVPRSFIGNTGDFLDFFMSKIRPAADTYLLYDIASK